MKTVPVIELYKKEFFKNNKGLSKDELENIVNLLININFYDMVYDKKIMDHLKDLKK